LANLAYLSLLASNNLKASFMTSTELMLGCFSAASLFAAPAAAPALGPLGTPKALATFFF